MPRRITDSGASPANRAAPRPENRAAPLPPTRAASRPGNRAGPRPATRPRRRRVSPLLAALLASGLAAASTPTLTLTITEDLADPAHPWGLFDAYPVELYDLNGDGTKEIISHNDNRYVYVFAANGTLLAELPTTFPQGWGARTINGVEAERMQPGYPVSLIVTNSAAYVTRFDYNASRSNATHFEFDKKWERRVNAFTANAGMDAKPTLIDANRNGIFEIIVQVEERGLFGLRHDGSYLWKQNLSGGNAEPVVSDGDRDGHMEAYFFSDDGKVRAIQSLTGVLEWTYDATQAIGWPASIPRGGTVAQVDGVGRREVVFCARDAHDAVNYQNNHMGLFVITNDDMDAWANLKWVRQPSWAAPLCYARPVVYDHNGNGAPEIYGMDWNTMGHNPGNWERTGPAHVFSYNKDGGHLWHTTLDTWWSNKDIAIADLDGDAPREVLVSGPSTDGAHDGWWVLNIANGTKEQFLDVSPYKSSRGPRLGDVDGDGDVDFVVSVEGNGNGTVQGEGAIQVWDAKTSPLRVVWGGAEDRYEAPAAFTALFEVHNDTNPDYVKLKVTSFHRVIAASYKVDNGTWQALDWLATGSDWTLWDQAVSIPKGSEVRFKARDDLGGERISGPYTWPPGSPPAAEPAPPGAPAPGPEAPPSTALPEAPGSPGGPSEAPQPDEPPAAPSDAPGPEAAVQAEAAVQVEGAAQAEAAVQADGAVQAEAAVPPTRVSLAVVAPAPAEPAEPIEAVLPAAGAPPRRSRLTTLALVPEVEATFQST